MYYLYYFIVNYLNDWMNYLVYGRGRDEVRGQERVVPAQRSHPAGIGNGAEAKRWETEIDEQYSQLIRETEEILTQLENDEFILFGRKPEDEVKSNSSS